MFFQAAGICTFILILINKHDNISLPPYLSYSKPSSKQVGQKKRTDCWHVNRLNKAEGKMLILVLYFKHIVTHGTDVLSVLCQLPWNSLLHSSLNQNRTQEERAHTEYTRLPKGVAVIIHKEKGLSAMKCPALALMNPN